MITLSMLIGKLQRTNELLYFYFPCKQALTVMKINSIKENRSEMQNIRENGLKSSR